MVLAGPAGDTINAAVAMKRAVGLDSYAAKLMFGDWLWWSDQVNGTIRLVSPQGFVAGRLANLSPEQSSLNKPLYSVIGSQKSGSPGSGQSASYSVCRARGPARCRRRRDRKPAAGRQLLGRARRPQLVVERGDQRRQLHAADQLHRRDPRRRHGPICRPGDQRRPVPPHARNAAQLSAKHDEPGPAWQHRRHAAVQRDLRHRNNPNSRTNLGYVQSDAQVRYQAINEKFIVNMEGGQTVQVTRQTLPSGQPA